VGAVNINGISKYVNWIEWDIIVKNMSHLQLDMFGITEPNINFNKKQIELHLREIAKTTDKNIQMSTSCSNQLNHTFHVFEASIQIQRLSLFFVVWLNAMKRLFLNGCIMLSKVWQN
jgi:hypothetical protein